MLRPLQIAFSVLAFLAVANPASAEKRVALVIGNSAYQNVTPLANPSNDAGAMTATLKSAGFDIVDSRRDLKANEMRRALRDFVDKSKDADVAVIYFAGHGVEIDGTNYLLPVDATLERDVDAYDEAIPLDRILTVMEPAKQLRLAILDACRDNPFNKSMKRTIGSRAVGRGLAKVEPTNPNTLIAFAAKAGSTASDGDSKNSPFTAALVNHIAKPGLDLRKAFGYVRDDVLRLTSNKQEPFVYGSLGGNDVMLVPPAPAASAAPTADNEAFVQRAYELAMQVGTKAVWDSFIAKYPSGLYTELAKAQRDKLASEAARQAATEKARAAQEEQTRLAIEGAKKAEQQKAAELARKAEQQRVAAEVAKRAEEAKVAEAEKAKAVEEARIAAEKKAAEEKAAEQKAKEAAEAAKQKLAALTPPADASTPKADAPVAVANIPKDLQAELKRVGCNTGPVDGNWNAASQKSLALFNANAKTKFDVKLASADALDAVKAKSARICPLICEFGYKADGERCNKIVCRAGFEVGDNNTCEKIEARTPVKPKPVAAKPAASEPRSQAVSGQMYCNTAGCFPLRKGCRAVSSGSTNGGVSASQREECN